MKAGTTILFALLLAAFPPVVCADEEALVLGVFPRRNATETVKMFTPMASHLAEQLGRKVTVMTARDFEAFWQGVNGKRYDIVQYNQYHYIRSAKSYQVIAHNKEFGKSTIAGALYVRRDSGISELAQLKGRTVLFGGGEDAMISYIAPVYMILQAGLKKDEFTAQFAINPLNSVIGVYRKQADAAGSGDIVIGQPAVKSAINPDELIALAVSEQLLHLPWAVKRTMPTALREAIQSSLVDLENTDTGRGVLKATLLTGIGRAEDKDYDPHRKMVRLVMGHL